MWWVAFCGTLCNTGIFRIQGRFSTLSNIYYEEFYSEPCVTLAYLKPLFIILEYYLLLSYNFFSQNFGYGLRVKRKEKYLYIQKCNNITNNSKKREITSCSKLQVLKKFHVARSNTDPFSLYYEIWHVRKPGIFIIRGIFRTLEHSKVRRYLDPCQA